MQVVKDSIAEAIEQVEQAGDLAAVLNLKKLKGFKTAYRIRIGVFMVGDVVEFARVVHRREVCKFFP